MWLLIRLSISWSSRWSPRFSSGSDSECTHFFRHFHAFACSLVVLFRTFQPPPPASRLCGHVSSRFVATHLLLVCAESVTMAAAMELTYHGCEIVTCRYARTLRVHMQVQSLTLSSPRTPKIPFLLVFLWFCFIFFAWTRRLTVLTASSSGRSAKCSFELEIHVSTVTIYKSALSRTKAVCLPSLADGQFECPGRR